MIKIESNKPLQIVDIVKRHPDEQIIIWTQYDEEGDILHKLIPTAKHLNGKVKQEDRIAILEDFRKNRFQVLISKPRLLGTGLNLQYCHICIFSWSADSFESYYQAVGRIQRYGQKNQVKVYIPYTNAELPMLENVMEKQKTYLDDSAIQEQLYIESLLDDIKLYAAKNLPAKINTEDNFLPDYHGKSFRLIHGDCIESMANMPENQFELAVFSPPFADLYSYTDKHQDIGNCNSLDDEFALHFSFFTHQLYRVMKPGCVVAMHIAPLPILKGTYGFSGIRDFPAECRELFESAGFYYQGKATIGKNPQAQAIRTKAHALLFKTLHKDSRQSRFAIPDFLMKFQKPGEAPPIPNYDITNDEWVKLASPIWDWVNETNTLNKCTKDASDGDVRHICPLQLDVIDACIRLWSGKGEHVLSPFMGIGSEGVVAVQHGRKFTGIELKEEYFDMAIKNIKEQERCGDVKQLRLFE